MVEKLSLPFDCCMSGSSFKPSQKRIQNIQALLLLETEPLQIMHSVQQLTDKGTGLEKKSLTIEPSTGFGRDRDLRTREKNYIEGKILGRLRMIDLKHVTIGRLRRMCHRRSPE